MGYAVRVEGVRGQGRRGTWSGSAIREEKFLPPPAQNYHSMCQHNVLHKGAVKDHLPGRIWGLDTCRYLTHQMGPEISPHAGALLTRLVWSRSILKHPGIRRFMPHT